MLWLFHLYPQLWSPQPGLWGQDHSDTCLPKWPSAAGEASRPGSLFTFYFYPEPTEDVWALWGHHF